MKALVTSSLAGKTFPSNKVVWSRYSPSNLGSKPTGTQAPTSVYFLTRTLRVTQRTQFQR